MNDQHQAQETSTAPRSARPRATPTQAEAMDQASSTSALSTESHARSVVTRSQGERSRPQCAQDAGTATPARSEGTTSTPPGQSGSSTPPIATHVGNASQPRMARPDPSWTTTTPAAPDNLAAANASEGSSATAATASPEQSNRSRPGINKSSDTWQGRPSAAHDKQTGPLQVAQVARPPGPPHCDSGSRERTLLPLPRTARTDPVRPTRQYEVRPHRRPPPSLDIRRRRTPTPRPTRRSPPHLQQPAWRAHWPTQATD
jgi:hypothetical protein